MGRDIGGELVAVQNRLNDAGNKGGAVELRHLLGHRDELRHQRGVVYQHVLKVRVPRLFQPVGLLAKDLAPDYRVDELQHAEHLGLALRQLAIAQGCQLEQPLANVVAKLVEPFLEVLDAVGLFLQVLDNLGKEE